MLKCPRCGAAEVSRDRRIVNIGAKVRGKRVVVVLFGCLFSATLDDGLTDEEMQEKLEDFERSGKMDEWLREPLGEHRVEVIVWSLRMR